VAPPFHRVRPVWGSLSNIFGTRSEQPPTGRNRRLSLAVPRQPDRRANFSGIARFVSCDVRKETPALYGARLGL
jgi:hypothetical protein